MLVPLPSGVTTSVSVLVSPTASEAIPYVVLVTVRVRTLERAATRPVLVERTASDPLVGVTVRRQGGAPRRRPTGFRRRWWWPGFRRQRRRSPGPRPVGSHW